MFLRLPYIYMRADTIKTWVRLTALQDFHCFLHTKLLGRWYEREFQFILLCSKYLKKSLYFVFESLFINTFYIFHLNFPSFDQTIFTDKKITFSSGHLYWITLLGDLFIYLKINSFFVVNFIDLTISTVSKSMGMGTFIFPKTF